MLFRASPFGDVPNAMEKAGKAYWILLAAAYLVGRYPFLSLGYGVDSDAWRIARSGADWLSGGGCYSPSRPPGYPAMELAAGIFRSAFSLNAFVALLGFGAVVAFYLLGRRLGIEKIRLATAAFAFAPLFWVFSSTSMDYVPALCFVLFAFLLAGKPIISGIVFGLAMTFRPASIVLLPALIYYNYQNGGRRAAIWSLSAALSFALLCFASLYSIYKIPFRAPFSVGMPIRRRLLFAGYRAYGAFGAGGWFAVAAGTILSIIHRDKSRNVLMLAALVVFPFLAMWAIFPHESGYWIAAVPFLIMTAFAGAGRSAYLIAILLILPVDISPRAKTPDGYRFAPHIVSGMVLDDFQTRHEIMRLRKGLPAYPAEDGSFTITGRDAALFELNPSFERAGEIAGHDLWKSKMSGGYFVDGLPAEAVDSLVSQGFHVKILQDAVSATALIFGWTPDEKGVEIFNALRHGN